MLFNNSASVNVSIGFIGSRVWGSPKSSSFPWWVTILSFQVQAPSTSKNSWKVQLSRILQLDHLGLQKSASCLENIHHIAEKVSAFVACDRMFCPPVSHSHTHTHTHILCTPGFDFHYRLQILHICNTHWRSWCHKFLTWIITIFIGRTQTKTDIKVSKIICKWKRLLCEMPGTTVWTVAHPQIRQEFRVNTHTENSSLYFESALQILIWIMKGFPNSQHSKSAAFPAAYQSHSLCEKWHTLLCIQEHNSNHSVPSEESCIWTNGSTIKDHRDPAQGRQLSYWTACRLLEAFNSEPTQGAPAAVNLQTWKQSFVDASSSHS